MGNKFSAAQQHNMEELRQGLDDVHLQHLLIQLVPTSTRSIEFESRLQQALTVPIHDRKLSALFGDTSFGVALTQELMQLGHQLVPDVPPTAGTSETTGTFYQVSTAAKSLVEGSTKQRVKTMKAIFQTLNITSLADQILFCHDILYAHDKLNVMSLTQLENDNLAHRFHLLFSMTVKYYIARHAFNDTETPPALSSALTSTILTYDAVFLLSMAQPKMLLQGQAWDKLYSNIENGNNYNNMCDALIGYAGTTIVVIRDTKGFNFGLLSPSEWTCSSSYFGTSLCCMFQIAPHFQLLSTQKRSGAGTHYQWMNTKDFRKDLPIGIGFGGDRT